MSMLNPLRAPETTMVLVADIGKGEVIVMTDGTLREVVDTPTVYKPTGRVEFGVCEPATREPRGTWSVQPDAKIPVRR